jgi:lysine/ornithine N-monooxygenase
MEEYG